MKLLYKIDYEIIVPMIIGAFVGVAFGLIFFYMLAPAKPKPCSAYSEYKLYDMPARCVRDYVGRK